MQALHAGRWHARGRLSRALQSAVDWHIECHQAADAAEFAVLSKTPTACAWQGVVDAFRSIARKESPAGLFRGLGPTVLTNAPFSALYYMFYKQLQTRLTKVKL